ncbi:hypothetical protein Zmor_027324 [Zophobas morio]|uniref:Uncharacterized protein n=2 Tax=Zophobas morio TaxID=2755281 RepID=A0AA38HQD2_9CUCU|nr:hypothetical protein Zmor_027324 [Zophobas morio]
MAEGDSPPPYTSLYPHLNDTQNLQELVSELQHSLSIQDKRIHDLEDELRHTKTQYTSTKETKTHLCTSKGYEWVATSTNNVVPPMAIHMCVDAHGNDVYVGRAHFGNELTPAHVAARAAYVPHYGKEHSVDNYHILCTNFFKWVPSSGGQVPPGAVQAGHRRDGAPLYVGRVYHEGSCIIGKVHPNFQACFFLYQGKEMHSSTYEVLIFDMS